QHALNTVEQLAAGVPALVDLQEQRFHVVGHLLRRPQRCLDPIEQLTAWVAVVADALHQDVVVALLRCWHWFPPFCYIMSTRGPRFRFRSSSLRPNSRFSS